MQPINTPWPEDMAAFEASLRMEKMTVRNLGMSEQAALSFNNLVGNFRQGILRRGDDAEKDERETFAALKVFGDDDGLQPASQTSNRVFKE